MNENMTPETSQQKIVYEIWKSKLGNVKFGMDDDFFDVGGTSLQAIEVLSKLSEDFEIEIADFFAKPTIRNIACCLRENPKAMKNKISDTFKFKELKEIDTEEWKLYQHRCMEIKKAATKADRYDSVLLLGATGFLGIYLLHELLKQSTSDIMILLRRDKMQSQQRLKQRYEYYFGEKEYKKNQKRIKIITGDLCQEKFGMGEIEYKNLALSVETVINSAALVKHMGKNSEFETINVDIVSHIIRFACEGRKKTIHHMSTIGIAFGGQEKRGNTLFTELDETISHKLANQYLHSKYKAEQELIKAREKGIETTIYRMSGILFDSKNGKFQKNILESTAYKFYYNLYKLGIVPAEIDRPMDISNVDMVSEAIVKLFLSNYSNNQIHHLVNPHSLEVSQILMYMGKQENDLIRLTADDMYDYYTKSKEEDQRYIRELVFECEIMSDIGKNTKKICMDRTVHILKKLGFEWNMIHKENIQRACLEAKKAGFS